MLKMASFLVKMLLSAVARRMPLFLLCLTVGGVLAGKLDQIRLPSHKRVKYMPADYKKVRRKCKK